MACRLFASLIGLVAAVGFVRGDPPPDIKPIRLVLHPAEPPVPALRYPLLPELRHQKPGNAAPLYRKAAEALKAVRKESKDTLYERVDRWRELPLDELRKEREQVKEYLAPFQPMLSIIEDAARRETCDWEFLEQVRTKGTGVAVASVSMNFGEFAMLLALRARAAVADGEVDDALADLQTMFAMARHAGQGPSLIHTIVGVAPHNLAMTLLEEIIQAPRVPNLYWSLTDTPQPFFDLRRAYQGERVVAYGVFPGLVRAGTDLRFESAKPEQIQEYGKILTRLTQDPWKPREPTKAEMDSVGKAILVKHDTGKRVLIALGRAREVVDKMPPLQVAALHYLAENDRELDEVMKWCGQPYWIAAPAILDFEKRRRSTPPKPDAPAVAERTSALLTYGMHFQVHARVERKTQALRCIEAIRLYAAHHKGKLPPRLDDIKEVPIPVDPMSGNPFEYKVEGEKATLCAPPIAAPVPDSKPQPLDAIRYEIALKK